MKCVFGKSDQVRIACCGHGCAAGFSIQQRHLPCRISAAKLRQDARVFAGHIQGNPQGATHHQVKSVTDVTLAKEWASRFDPYRLQLRFEVTQGGLWETAEHFRNSQRHREAVPALLASDKSIEGLDLFRMTFREALESFTSQLCRTDGRDCANGGPAVTAVPESKLPHSVTWP